MSFFLNLKNRTAPLFSLSISLKTMFLAAFVVSMVAFISTFLVMGESFQFDVVTLFLSLSLLVLLAGGLILMPERAFPMTILLCAHLSVFYIPRLYWYLLIPENISLPYPLGMQIEEINGTIVYLIAGCFAMFVGIFAGSYVWQKFLSGTETDEKSDTIGCVHPAIYPLVLLLVLISGYMLLTLGNVQVGGHTPIRHRTMMMALRTLIGSDSGFFFGFVALFLLAHRNPKNYFYLYLLIVMYTFYLTIVGSKGATFRISQILLVVYAVRFGSLPIKVWKLIGIAILLTAVSPRLFRLANNLKLMHVLQIDSYAEVESNLNPQPMEFRNNQVYSRESTRPRPGPNAARIYFRRNLEPRLIYFIPILNRLGESDYLIFALYKVRDEEQRKIVFSQEYLWKSVANILLPGDPYPEADLRTERYPPLLYMAWAKQTIRKNFNTEPYSAWGVAYFYFGKVGGLFFLTIVSTAMVIIFETLRTKLFTCRYAYSSLFAWGGFMCFLGSFGLDNNLTTLIFLILQTVILQAVAKLIAMLSSGLSRRVSQ